MKGCYNLTLNSQASKGLFHDGFTFAIQIGVRYEPLQERHMDARDSFRITLTPEQKNQVRQATGKDADAIELSFEELEERIAPVTRSGYRSIRPPL
jgi:hypothetical protein